MHSADYVMGLFGILLGFMAFIFIIALVIYVLEVIGLWKMFKKAGQPGWASLIPIYNIYILYKIVGVNTYWLLISILLGLFGNIIPVIGPLLSLAVNIYVAVLVAISTANSFGKDTGFGIVSIFFAPVCHMIIGLGDAEYLGPKPMDDFVFKNISSANNSGASAGTKDTGKFCTNCGASLTNNSNYCPYCGSESK